MKSEIVICGAGIAGISTAYHLTVGHGIRDVLLVDERPPLSLTSDKSTECYRNWWPQASMVGLMNRSIDLLEGLAGTSGNRFHLNRRGYLYVTADPAKVAGMLAAGQAISRAGAGPLRVHRGEENEAPYQPNGLHNDAIVPGGADLICDPALLRRHFPALGQNAAAALHVRRAGWFSAQQLGMLLLEQAVAHGARLVNDRVCGVKTSAGQVQSVRLASDREIETDIFVNAAGPILKEVGRMLEVELPVFCEVHLKAAFSDHLGIVPREAPLMIWNDSQSLKWDGEERALLADDEETGWLLDELPPGAHCRPEGGQDSPVVLMLWEYRDQVIEPVWPPPLDPLYPEIALRGLAAMLPGLEAYFGRLPRLSLDGGYYTKTPENLPLVGSLPVRGAYLIGALSGYGLMSAPAAGELLAAQIAGSQLPDYATAFGLERYQVPGYLDKTAAGWDSGQL